MSSWTKLVREHCQDAVFFEPCSLSSIISAESNLRVEFDPHLRSCLQETNGIKGEYGLGLLWSLERIVHDNRDFRENPLYRDLYMPFDSLLFFADAGNGDQFCFPIQDGKVRRHDVFVWDHEDDSRRWAAPSLADYLTRWLSGTLTV